MPASTSAGASSFSVLPEPAKSSNDKKDYKVIALRNGLRVLLISDTSYPLDKLAEEEATVLDEDDEMDDDDEDDEVDDEEDESDDMDCEGEDGDEMPPNSKRRLAAAAASSSSGLKKSAAGLCVSAGSFSDPSDMPGLAHFLEHMVFMGSEKYPDENSFDDFIQRTGGTDNAHTDCETTVFYFETQRKSFREALDRFAQFFIAPLMKKNAMEREREAVDSEFEQALPSDYNRRQQIFGGLARPDHPMAKFMWGSTASLTADGKMPNREAHRRLVEFKGRHYSAPSMTLAVQSQEQLDTLQEWVRESFSAVPDNGQPREDFARLSDPFKTEGFSRLYKLAPIRETYQVDLNWALPPLQSEYRKKPLHYLSWVIGHEGKGSLISYLRKKVWALSLTAGNAGDGFEHNSTYSIFTLTVVLTKAGFENLEDVLAAVFSYLKMMERVGVSERIFKEIKEIEDLDFEFSEEKQPAENVETLCENMHFYPPELYLTGDELLFEYDAKLISECLAGLNAKEVNVFVMAKEFREECKLTEPWFKTRYTVEDISDGRRKRWADPEVIEDFHLPEPNVFIAEDNSLKPVPAGNPKYPRKVTDSRLGEMFHRMDDTFKQPRGHILFHLLSPEAVFRSVKDAVCLDLLVNSACLLMVEELYPAEIAQLGYNFYSTERGIAFKVSGLNDKLHLLLETMTRVFCDYKARITPTLFKAVAEQTKKNYYNAFIKPSKLNTDARLSLIQEPYRQTCQKHAVVLDLSMDDVNAFLDRFRAKIFIQGLAQGNVTEAEAVALFEALASKLGANPPSISDLAELRCRELPFGCRALTANSLNLRDGNTVIVNYYQGEPGTIKNHALAEMANMLLEEPVFNRLRTEEQLGYTVYCMLRNTFGVLGVSISIYAQASKFTPEHLDERIEAFFKWFLEDKLANMDPDEYQQMLDTLVKLKKAADVRLGEEVGRNWGEICSREYFFDRHEKEIEMLESVVTKERVAEYIRGLVGMEDQSTRRKLSVRVVGNDKLHVDKGEDDEMPVADAEEDDPSRVFEIKCVGNGTAGEIADAPEFAKALKVYPVIRITK